MIRHAAAWACLWALLALLAQAPAPGPASAPPWPGAGPTPVPERLLAQFGVRWQRGRIILRERAPGALAALAAGALHGACSRRRAGAPRPGVLWLLGHLFIAWLGALPLVLAAPGTPGLRMADGWVAAGVVAACLLARLWP